MQSDIVAENGKRNWSDEQTNEKYTEVVALLKEYKREYPDHGTKERFAEIQN